MNICVFENYKVHLVNEYDYITDKEFGEYSYATEREEWTKEMDGCELLHLIIQILNNSETITVDSREGHIAIEQFNSIYGTSARITVDYEYIQKKLQKEVAV